MKLSIYGIEQDLEIREGCISLLNVHNKMLYRKLLRFLIYDLDDMGKNEIVIYDEERLNGKYILYVHNIELYKFETKIIIDSIVKTYIKELNASIVNKSEETEIYFHLLNPLLHHFDLLEIDYDIKEELDGSFYTKIPGFDFSMNNALPEIDKIISVLKIGIKIFHKRLFIFNNVIPLLTKEDIEVLNIFVRNNNIFLLLIDYLDDSEVVITNNLCIGPDFGTYSL